jgi:two-component system, LuxR family, response regulator FixJ
MQLVAIVDDDASVRQSLCRLIRSFGYRAEAFAGGHELLTSAALHEAACLIVDVRMPEMDGLELQERIAADGVRVPIVFLTAHAGDDEERRAREAGAYDFLRKPVGRGAVLQAVQRALAMP